jgi:competence protein ComEC
VSPALAIISAGRHNRFGHPHPEVLERLARAGARVVRLDEQGGTIVRSDGMGWWVSGYGRAERPVPLRPRPALER